MEGGEMMRDEEYTHVIPDLFYEQDKKMMYSHPEEKQYEVLQNILSRNADTRFGREYLFGKITDITDFRTYVPLSLYSDMHPYIQAMIGGKTNMLVKDPIQAWTNPVGIWGQKRLIPYTQSVSRGFIDAWLRLYTACAAQHLISEDQHIVSGLEQLYNDTLNTLPVGTLFSLGLRDLQTVPGVGRILTPSTRTRTVPDIETRWKKIAAQVSHQHIGGIMEDPVSFFMFMKTFHLTDHKWSDTGEWWPQDVLFISHTTIRFFESLLTSLLGPLVFRQIMCIEDIPVAVQLDSGKGCVPLCNQHVFEFISVKEWREMEEEGEQYREFEFSPRYLSTVIPGEEYILVITTSGGLYRYVSGDIITMVDRYHMKRVGYMAISEKRRPHKKHKIILNH
jgi:hypothetical protein